MNAQQLVFFDFDPRSYKDWINRVISSPTDNHYIFYDLIGDLRIPPWITILISEQMFKHLPIYLRMEQPVKGMCFSGHYLPTIDVDILRQMDWCMIGLGPHTNALIKMCEDHNIYIYCPMLGYLEYPPQFHSLKNLNEIVEITTAERTIRCIPSAIERCFLGAFRGTELCMTIYDIDLKSTVVLPVIEITGMREWRGWLPIVKTKLILPSNL